MAVYKVSYKVLRQQGEEMKAVAKMVDEYASRVEAIRSKLGNDNMLAPIRDNLRKMNSQLGESRAILNTAGELLIKNVENYGGVETRQVKKVDAMKAHNRDFYKNPVVVASVGGAAGGAAAGVGAAAAGGATPQPAPATTINNTDNSVTNNYYAAPEQAGGAAATDAAAPLGTDTPLVAGSQKVGPDVAAQEPASAQTPGSVSANTAGSATGVTAQASIQRGQQPDQAAGPGMSAGTQAALGGASGAVAAGSVLGATELAKRSGKKGEPEDDDAAPPGDGDDLSNDDYPGGDDSQLAGHVQGTGSTYGIDESFANNPDSTPPL